MKKQPGIKKQIKKRPLGKKTSPTVKEQSPPPKAAPDVDMQLEDQSCSKIIYTHNGNNTTNNIENNNFFNQVYNFRCSNVEHVVQNIYITVDDNGVPTKPSSYHPYPAETHHQADFQMEVPQ